MNRNECMTMLEAFEGTFAKRYSQVTKDRVYERCSKVPSRLVEAITERIESQDKHPDNVGNAILAAWHALDPNDARSAQRTVPCPWCDGDGEITCYRKDPKSGRVTVSVALCAHCRPGAPYSTTREALRASGYLIPPDNRRKTLAQWWHAYMRNLTRFAMPTYAEAAGNLMPGDMLADFDRMVAAAQSD